MQSVAYNISSSKVMPIYTQILLHILLAILIMVFPLAAIIYGILFFSYGILKIIQTSNKGNEAAYFAVYLACYEILIRMVGSVIIYEFGKYSASLILLVGMLVESNSRKLPVLGILYFCLLIPSIFAGNYDSFETFKNSISFNLSGPFSLMMSWVYFLNRKFTKIEFERLLFQMILPIISVVVFILISIPTNFDFSAATTSTKALSGGFGPNQVAVVLGFGFFVSSLSILLGQKIFASRMIAFIPPFVFIGFGIITFSRGGVLTGIIALILSAFVYIRLERGSMRFSRFFFGIVFTGLFAYIGWSLINSYTSDSISRRYESTINQSNEGAGQAGHYTERIKIAEQDIAAFKAHPILGNGPEGASRYRAANFNSQLTAHTEFTRLLGDHGILGLIALLIMVFSPIYYYRQRNGDNKIILIGFMSICFLTMFHAAMRLAIPGLAFGLALIDVNLQEHSLERT